MKDGMALDLLVLFGGTVAYCLPSMIAFVRKHEALRGIMILNIGLGWTMIGWVASMVWACSRPDQRPQPSLRPMGNDHEIENSIW